MRTIFSQDRPLSRRAFLAGTGALVVAIGTPRLLNPKAAFARLEDDFPIGPASIDPAQIDSWVAIGGDGIVTIFTGKEEQGTGVGTAQLQVAADELDVPLSKLRLIISDTTRTPDQGFSAASQSLMTWSCMASGSAPLRRTSSWKARRSKASPSAPAARWRRACSRSSPTL